VDRFQKIALAQNQQRVLYELLKRNGESLEDSSGHTDRKPTVEFDVLTDSGPNIEEIIGQ